MGKKKNKQKKNKQQESDVKPTTTKNNKQKKNKNSKHNTDEFSAFTTPSSPPPKNVAESAPAEDNRKAEIDDELVWDSAPDAADVAEPDFVEMPTYRSDFQLLAELDDFCASYNYEHNDDKIPEDDDDVDLQADLNIDDDDDDFPKPAPRKYTFFEDQDDVEVPSSAPPPAVFAVPAPVSKPAAAAATAMAAPIISSSKPAAATTTTATAAFHFSEKKPQLEQPTTKLHPPQATTTTTTAAVVAAVASQKYEAVEPVFKNSKLDNVIAQYLRDEEEGEEDVEEMEEEEEEADDNDDENENENETVSYSAKVVSASKLKKVRIHGPTLEQALLKRIDVDAPAPLRLLMQHLRMLYRPTRVPDFPLLDNYTRKAAKTIQKTALQAAGYFADAVPKNKQLLQKQMFFWISQLAKEASLESPKNNVWPLHETFNDQLVQFDEIYCKKEFKREYPVLFVTYKVATKSSPFETMTNDNWFQHPDATSMLTTLVAACSSSKLEEGSIYGLLVFGKDVALLQVSKYPIGPALTLRAKVYSVEDEYTDIFTAVAAILYGTNMNNEYSYKRSAVDKWDFSEVIVLPSKSNIHLLTDLTEEPVPVVVEQPAVPKKSTPSAPEPVAVKFPPPAPVVVAPVAPTPAPVTVAPIATAPVAPSPVAVTPAPVPVVAPVVTVPAPVFVAPAAVTPSIPKPLATVEQKPKQEEQVQPLPPPPPVQQVQQQAAAVEQKPTSAPQTSSTVAWVTLFMQRFASKYGLAYMLNNGFIGAHFNDQTMMLWNPFNDQLEYIHKVSSQYERQGFSLQTPPADVMKKVTIIKNFRICLERLIKEGRRPLVPSMPASASAGPVEYVKHWTTSPHITVFRYSNKMMQACFSDGAQLLVAPDNKSGMFINAQGQTNGFALNSPSVPKEIATRVQFLKDHLKEVLTKQK